MNAFNWISYSLLYTNHLFRFQIIDWIKLKLSINLDISEAGVLLNFINIKKILLLNFTYLIIYQQGIVGTHCCCNSLTHPN